MTGSYPAVSTGTTGCDASVTSYVAHSVIQHHQTGSGALVDGVDGDWIDGVFVGAPLRAIYIFLAQR